MHGRCSTVRNPPIGIGLDFCVRVCYNLFDIISEISTISLYIFDF